MKQAITILLISISYFTNGQVDTLKHYCSIDNAYQPETVYPIEPSRQAQRIIDTLLKHIPVSKNTIDFYATDVNKACAVIVDGRRVVYFNEDYLEGIQESKQTRWTVYFVLAHEVAHHLNADPLDKSKNRHITELEADCQAAKVLAHMGATEDETLAVIDLFNANDTETHPRSSARKAKARNCWFDARDIPVDKNKPVRIENCIRGNGVLDIDNATANKYVIKIRINGFDAKAERAKKILGYSRDYHIGQTQKKQISLPPANYTISFHKDAGHGWHEGFATQTETINVETCISYPIFIERD